MTIVDLEVFIMRIEKLVQKEQMHLNWLYEKKIEILNKKRGCLHHLLERFDFVLPDIDKMIDESEQYLRHYETRLEEYRYYVVQLKEQ